MHTSRALPYGGSDRDPLWTETPSDRDSQNRDPQTKTPGQRPPRKRPLDRDPQAENPQAETPGQDPQTENPLTETPRQRPHWTDLPDRDPLDRDTPWTEILLDREPSLDRDPRSCELWCMLGQRPPVKRLTDRQVLKHHLAATSLRAVIKV